MARREIEKTKASGRAEMLGNEHARSGGSEVALQGSLWWESYGIAKGAISFIARSGKVRLELSVTPCRRRAAGLVPVVPI